VFAQVYLETEDIESWCWGECSDMTSFPEWLLAPIVSCRGRGNNVQLWKQRIDL
jgi:hypothetical protein